MELIKSDKIEMGICLIDIYRQMGDLYSSYDIVKQSEDGSFARLPDARYGVDQPEYDDEDLGDVRRKPINIQILTETFDRNGWTVVEESVIGDGKILCHRSN
jgi:hypothetical protein